MQKSMLQVETVTQSSFRTFIDKLKVVRLVLKSKKSFVVVDNEINVFNMSNNEVASDCSVIYYNLSNLDLVESNNKYIPIVHQSVLAN